MKRRSILSRLITKAVDVAERVLLPEEIDAPPPPQAVPFRPAGTVPQAEPEEEIVLTNLRKLALRTREHVVKLPADKDGPRWDVAGKQLELEAEFAAFCMAWWEQEPRTTDFDEIRRRALIATTVYHEVPIEDLPPHLRAKTGE